MKPSASIAFFVLVLQPVVLAGSSRFERVRGEFVIGSHGAPANQIIPEVQPRRKSLAIRAASDSTGVEIIPASPTEVGNCIPFGNNTAAGFTGFIYREVPAFSALPGDELAFDLGGTNDVEIRRNIHFAIANFNPAPATGGANTATQGVAALEWVKVVSETQIPRNPLGNFVKGDYELVYTFENSFVFPGGGFIIGFESAPPGTYEDFGCEQLLVETTSADVSGYFYARFYNKPHLTLEVLDNITRGGSGVALGGFVIRPNPCARDEEAPVLVCPTDIVTRNLPGSCSAVFGPGTPSVTDNCPGVTVVGSRSDALELADPYPVGTTRITWTATDAAGHQTSCAQIVTVKDEEPPITGLSVDKPILWPPNHEMIDVTVFYDTRDNCGGTLTTTLTVTSSEPINGVADGDTAPDWEVVTDHLLRLRAERAGTGKGRTYTITVTTVDASGNQGISTTTVQVPHNQ